MGVSAGTGEEQRYETALADVWTGLSRTVSRLDALAAEPERLAVDDEAVSVPRLQYALHEASELVLGLEPPPEREAIHAELLAALSDARDLTAALCTGVEREGPAFARPLVYEWRGALFRIRLAGLRLAEEPPLAPADPVELELPFHARAVLAVALVLAGATAVLAGAVAALWPLWATGFVLVTAACFVYRRP